MQQLSTLFVLSLVLLVGTTGCLPSDSDDPTNLEQLMNEATPAELVAEFTEMAMSPEEWVADFGRHNIVRQLNTMGPDTLKPIIALMGAEDSSSETRLYILQALADRVAANYMQDVANLLRSDDAVTRACAITLIGHIDHPDAMKLLNLAQNDTDARVRFSALSGKAIQGDPASRNELLGKYFDTDTKVQYKREVIRVILRNPQLSDVEILLSALEEDYVYIKTRALVAETLGFIGDPSAIDPLQTSLTQYEDETYIKLASAAIEELKIQREADATDGQ